jgi:hypothetical protein
MRQSFDGGAGDDVMWGNRGADVPLAGTMPSEMVTRHRVVQSIQAQ